MNFVKIIIDDIIKANIYEDKKLEAKNI